MVTIRCPHCSTFATFTERWRDEPEYSRLPLRMAALSCDSCDNPIVALIEIGCTPERLANYWPKKIEGKKYSDVPEHIACLADEAYRCRDVRAFRGAAVLARTTIEMVAQEKGAKGRTAEDLIDALFRDGHITEPMKIACHGVRWAGNHAAHRSEAQTSEALESSCELILQVMDIALQHIYQYPAATADLGKRLNDRFAPSVKK